MTFKVYRKDNGEVYMTGVGQFKDDEFVGYARMTILDAMGHEVVDPELPTVKK